MRRPPLRLLALPLLLAACWGADTGARRGELVRFEAEDGVQLVGELRGSGPRGIVLAHMFGSDRGAWGEFAALLADRDYRTLAFDFRGFGESGGSRDVAAAPLDVLAAIETVRNRGAESVVVIGASVGGTAALAAASRGEVALDGVVTLSAPARFLGLETPQGVVSAVEEPKLFIAAEGDGPAAASAQDFYNLSTPPKRVEIVTGSEHGTALLEGPKAEVVRNLILGFLERTV